MTAICGDCAEVVSWRATRGSRLADLACSSGHRGALNKARWDSELDRYVIVDNPSAVRGKTYGRCALERCAKRRLTGKLKTLPTEIATYYGQVVPAGSTICKFHDLYKVRT